MPRSPLSRALAPWFAVLFGTLAASSAGCVDDPMSSTCAAERWDAQPRSRFIIGQTFYLPTVAEGAACQGLAWELEEAPSGNQNAVVAGQDGIARFTPHVPGTYSFALGGERETLNVIAADGLPHHNLNYFPASSIAAVNGELWTANVYSPTLTRLKPGTLETLGQINVGSWPVAVAWSKGMAHAVVAQRGSDTLGLVDIESGRIEDAIWVGDEPSNVRVSPDGKTAFVALATERAVAIVDLDSRSVRARVETGWDPVAMALSPDGATLFVASHRSGHPSRFPFGEDPVEEEKDITVVDTKSAAVVGHFLDVAATLNGLLVSEDGARLYVAATRSDPSVSLVDETKASFSHLVIALDAITGEEVAAADLTRQASSKGYAVTTHAMALEGGRLWVAVEGSDLAVALDPMSLEELARVEVPGRPRGLIAEGGAVFAHGAQGMSATRIEGLGEKVTHGSTGKDPRPELEARGLRYYTGAGEGYGRNHTCNSCHADGLSDTLVWKAGPFEFRAVTRPQFWLEGTDRLGWSGYVANVKNFAWAVNNTIGVFPNTDQAEGLHAYLSSLMPPPAANGKTKRDGSLSDQAMRGKSIYEGKGACASCHALPLGTNREILEEGVTPDTTDVPSLVGSYRHGVWLKQGEARDLRAAVDAVVSSLGLSALSEEESNDLVRYLEELTARDFFLLASDATAKNSAGHAFGAPIRLTFSQPVWNDAKNLEAIAVKDADDNAIAASVKADGRYVTITPAEGAIKPGAAYSVTIGEAFEALDEKRINEATVVPIKTANAAATKLDGAYVWAIQMPVPDIANQSFDPDKTVLVTVNIEATPSAGGATMRLNFSDDLTFDAAAVIDGSMLITPPVPIPAGTNLADSTGLTGALVDDDGDGIADRASGTLIMSGPGFEVKDIAWELKRPAAPDVCEEGPSGALAVAITKGMDGNPIIDWGATEGLGLYVTSPSAELPAGPGQTVKNGDTYWSIQLASFPKGFLGPVTYGVVPDGAADTTEQNGGMPGGAPLKAGDCYKFSVITTSFEQGQFIMKWQ
ncbi:MAG: Ig-like domain-containing protein [Polyangiaceae bacterium]|nr:Ig-like domain-containing protein [Polyangiaceae bacterium]